MAWQGSVILYQSCLTYHPSWGGNPNSYGGTSNYFTSAAKAFYAG